MMDGDSKYSDPESETKDNVTAGGVSEMPQSSESSTSSSISNANGSEQKRPMNAFLMFCKSQRSFVKKQHPQLENRGITRILGDQWSKLDKNEKHTYTEKARQHKEAFMRANPDFKWYKTDLKPIRHQISSDQTISNVGAGCHPSQNLPTANDGQKQHEMKIFAEYKSGSSSHQQFNLEMPHRFANDFDSNLSVITSHSDIKSSLPDFHLSNVKLQPKLESVSEKCSIDSPCIYQPGAPKPPKKRYLEDGHLNQDAPSDKHTLKESRLHKDCVKKEKVVPYHLDQDMLDRVIDNCYSDFLDKNSVSKNNGNNPSLVQSIDSANHLNIVNGPMTDSFTNANYSTAQVPTPVRASLSSFQNITINQIPQNPQIDSNDEQPVDFSMNRTITTNRQQIINNLVEKMLSEPLAKSK